MNTEKLQSPIPHESEAPAGAQTAFKKDKKRENNIIFGIILVFSFLRFCIRTCVVQITFNFFVTSEIKLRLRYLDSNVFCSSVSAGFPLKDSSFVQWSDISRLHCRKQNVLVIVLLFSACFLHLMNSAINSWMCCSKCCCYTFTMQAPSSRLSPGNLPNPPFML